MNQLANAESFDLGSATVPVAVSGVSPGTLIQWLMESVRPHDHQSSVRSGMFILSNIQQRIGPMKLRATRMEFRL